MISLTLKEAPSPEPTEIDVLPSASFPATAPTPALKYAFADGHTETLSALPKAPANLAVH